MQELIAQNAAGEVWADIPADAGDLWICFGSKGQRSTLPFRCFGDQVGLISVLSRADDWYQSPDVIPLLEAVRSRRGRHPARALAFGTSMGGFASLAFAAFVGAERVIAVAPQVVLEPGADSRWATPANLLQPDARTGIGRASIAIVYDPEDAHDARHAAMLGSTVRRVRFPGAGHEVLRPICRFGWWAELINALAVDDAARLVAIEEAWLRGRCAAA